MSKLLAREVLLQIAHDLKRIRLLVDSFLEQEEQYVPYKITPFDDEKLVTFRPEWVPEGKTFDDVCAMVETGFPEAKNYVPAGWLADRGCQIPPCFFRHMVRLEEVNFGKFLKPGEAGHPFKSEEDSCTASGQASTPSSDTPSEPS